MPLTAAAWWYFSRGTVESDRDDPGVYEMGNASDSVIYIGSSDALRRRLKEHLSESGTCIRRTPSDTVSNTPRTTRLASGNSTTSTSRFTASRPSATNRQP